MITPDAAEVRFLYSQRHSKHVQRRMVVDACRRLRAFAPLEEYQYVGMGSYEFVDFELVRRELGVVEMDSIEFQDKLEDRCEFNRPFDQIRIHMGRASAVLPTLLDRPARRIVWLDYVGRLDREVLSDVATCMRKLDAGSVVVVTIRASSEAKFSDRRAQLIQDVGHERVDATIGSRELGKGFADVQRDILATSLAERLAQRVDSAALRFEQLFDIRYTDSTPMQTWGGILVERAADPARVREVFAGLEQVSFTGQDRVHATVPPLTVKEAIALNQQLPAAGALQAVAIPDEDLAAYQRLYRWYPPVPAAM